MSNFSELDYQMQKYASDHGMVSPTPIQRDGFGPIMHGDKNVILSGCTSGGKTFAVFGAILSVVDFSGRGIAVLDILPTKALINDQFIQISEMCGYMYVAVNKWHGDVKQSEKNRVVRDPSGILEITPESIEARFQNHSEQIEELFSGLKFIVIDEIHHYYGQERGCQLISLIYRLQQRIGKVRTIAMSATVGKDDYLVREYTGDPDNTIVVRDSNIRDTDFSIRYYSREEDDDSKDLPQELIADIYAETKDKEGMVFCNSRGTTEEVAVKLKALNPSQEDAYGSHHSSVSKEEREHVEDYARQGKTTPCCTSTMEVGINIGKISVVCMVESPYSVSSFIQRSGRSGRTTGKAVVRMFCSDKWSLLRGIACWNLYKRGYAENPDNTIEWHNVALQQLISTVKEKGPIDKQALIEEFLDNPAFKKFCTKSDYEALVNHALENGIFDVSETDGGLILGVEGEKRVGKKDSYIVFPTMLEYRAMYQDYKVGEHERGADDKKGDCFYLGSKIWEVTGIDDQKCIFQVVPATEGKKPKFTSFGLRIGMELEQEMKDILMSKESYPFIDEQANAQLTELRAEFSKCSTMGKVKMPFYVNEAGVLCIYPFAGTKVFNTMKTLFNAMDDEYELSMNISKSQFIEACKAWLDTNESLLPKVKQMITDGVIPLRHRYEKDLDLEHQARMELTINMSEKETHEYIKNIIS